MSKNKNIPEENSQAESNEDVFSTRDLYLAATLITLKFPMIGIDYQIIGAREKIVGYFKFENTTALTEARRKFMSSLLQVEPQAFVTAMHSLKADVAGAFTNPNNRVF